MDYSEELNALDLVRKSPVSPRTRRAIEDVLLNFIVRKGSFFAECDRDERGRCKPGSGGGSKPADEQDTTQPAADPAPSSGVSSGTPTSAAEQRHAEGNQDRLAATLKDAKPIPGNAPSDVEQQTCKPRPCHRHQLEMKTLLTSKKGGVRMTSAAQARKLLRRDEAPPAVRRQWTVVVDHREAYSAGNLEGAQVFPCYLKEGTGSFNVANMHKVESAEELESLLNTPADKLPDKARPPDTGFYAEWGKASPEQRQAIAEAAFERERARVARRKGKS